MYEKETVLLAKPGLFRKKYVDPPSKPFQHEMINDIKEPKTTVVDYKEGHNSLSLLYLQPLQCDFAAPSTKKWSTCPYSLSLDGFVTCFGLQNAAVA